MKDRNLKEIEEEVRKYWNSLKVDESNPSKGKEKFFITAAFPYPNSPQHIGHMRTYTITDIYARYKRMMGYNVLFPMGFHVTGTPILAMAKRIEEGDEELLRIFENIYGISREKAKQLTDPKELVMYFSKEIEEGMKLAGYSIDWRRKFYTFDIHFNKFIEWQFKKLEKAGLLVKGKHPIPFSLKLNSAVGAHDTKGDIDPEIEEITAIKFKFNDGFIITATYRPETLFGVTNIWINPNSTIIKIEHNGEYLYLTEEAFNELQHQINGKPLEKIKAPQLIGKSALHPLTKEPLPILPATFVIPDQGTGIVMSVPAHAPFDYIALKEANANIEIKKIIELEGFDIPAKQIVEKYGITSQTQKDLLEEATKELYKLENKYGKMIAYKKGLPVNKAKDLIRNELLEKGLAFPLYIIANGPIYSRAGDKVIVKIVEDQWFIDYGNNDWKQKTTSYLKEMRIIPEEIREQLLKTVEWLQKKACTRSKGLGTRFPLDKDKVIESLSDSTIYMAFYTISHKIKEFDPEELDEAFFDYLFLGIGKPKNELHKQLREEFLYWYPLDSRHSGADLVRNHLVFFVMNHIAIFPKELWPKQIVVNGFVLMEGKKMSKSLGNILTLRNAISQYGADIVRFAVVSGAELLQDTDFNTSVAEGIRNRLKFFMELLENKDNGKDELDEWIESVFYKKLENINELFENFELRKIALLFFYDFYNELKWYMERRKGRNLKNILKEWLKIIYPFMPYFTTYYWLKLGEKSIINFENLPKPKPYNKKIILAEDIIKDIYHKAERIKKLLEEKNIKKDRLYIYIPKNWKFKLFEELKQARGDRQKIKQILSKYDKLEIQKLMKKLKNKIYSINEFLEKDYLISYLEKSKPFLEEKLGLKVFIEEEKEKASYPTDISVEIK